MPCKRSSAVPIPFGVGFQFLGHAVSLRQLRHDQLHAVSCRFVNLSAILSYVHPAIRPRFLHSDGDEKKYKKTLDSTIIAEFNIYDVMSKPHGTDALRLKKVG